MHQFSIGRLPQRDFPDRNADRYAYLGTAALEQLLAEKPNPACTYYLKIVDSGGRHLYLQCRKWLAGDNTIFVAVQSREKVHAVIQRFQEMLRK